MTQIKSLFATRLYHAKISAHGTPIDPAELENSCLVIAGDDEAGQDWCEENGFPGYTSYASLSDLPWRFPIFKDLVAVLDAHVAAFADGASAIKFEDPRLAMMMAAPTRVKDARDELRTFFYAKPQVGDVLLWESWLRHEVPMNMAEDDRISVSFNYSWG